MAKRKIHRIDKVISDLDETKKKQILAEIRSIRIQSVIAIASVLGSAVAFIVVQQSNIKNLFESSPKLSIICEDVFLKRAGRIRIVSVTDKNFEYESDLRNLNDMIDLPEGAYNSSIMYDGKEIWNESFLMEVNRTQLIKLPEFFQNKINVYVTNTTPIAKPSSKLPIEINSSGNGFLWIYELVTDKELKLLFPATDEIKLMLHQISAKAPFQFPNNVYLAAGNDEKDEKYIFLVTSINDLEYATQLVTNIFGKDIEKGEILAIEKNWGMATLDVKVKR